MWLNRRHSFVFVLDAKDNEIFISRKNKSFLTRKSILLISYRTKRNDSHKKVAHNCVQKSGLFVGTDCRFVWAMTSHSELCCSTPISSYHFRTTSHDSRWRFTLATVYGHNHSLRVSTTVSLLTIPRRYCDDCHHSWHCLFKNAD